MLAALAFPVAGHGAEDLAALSAQVRRCFEREDPHCAEPWIKALEAQAPQAAAVAYTRGYQAMLAGDFERASRIMRGVSKNRFVAKNLRQQAVENRRLSSAVARVTATMRSRRLLGGQVEVWFRPGPDEVMLDPLEEVLAKALPGLQSTFGSAGAGPIRLHIYSKVKELGLVSGLTESQIENSGTIALCKYNRLMMTSPSALMFGYHWADTVVHELVHYLLIKNAGDQVPVWLHEGLARSFEASWRGRSPLRIDTAEQQVLVAAAKRGRFVPFSRMSPTMAKLPSQQITQLAFAEVHHVTAMLLRLSTSRAAKPTQAPALPASVTVATRRLVSLFDQGANEAGVIEDLVGLSRPTFLKMWRRQLRQDAGKRWSRLPHMERRRLLFKRSTGKRDRSHGLGARARHFAELGDRLLALERPLAAVIEYRKALNHGAQTSPLLLSRLSRALLRLGEVDAAAKRIGQGRQAHPDHGPLLVLSAKLLLAQNRPKEAIEASRRAQWVNPFDPEVHRVARQAWLRLNDKVQASRALLRERQVSAAK
jgi:hypothetical protein